MSEYQQGGAARKSRAEPATWTTSSTQDASAGDFSGVSGTDGSRRHDLQSSRDRGWRFPVRDRVRCGLRPRPSGHVGPDGREAMGERKPWELSKDEERGVRADLRKLIAKARQKGWSSKKFIEKYAKALTKTYEEQLREMDTAAVRAYNSQKGFVDLWFFGGSGPYQPMFPNPESKEQSTQMGPAKVQEFYFIVSGQQRPESMAALRKLLPQWTHFKEQQWDIGTDWPMEDHLLGMLKYTAWKLSGEEDRQLMMIMALYGEWGAVAGAPLMRTRVARGPVGRNVTPPGVPPGRAPMGKRGSGGLGLRGPVGRYTSPEGARQIAGTIQKYGVAGAVASETIKGVVKLTRQIFGEAGVPITPSTRQIGQGVLGRIQRTAQVLGTGAEAPLSRSSRVTAGPEIFRHTIDLHGDARIAYGGIRRDGSIRLAQGGTALYGEGVYAYGKGGSAGGRYIDIEVPAGTGVETLTFERKGTFYRIVPESGNSLPVRVVGSNLTPEEIAFADKLFPR